MADGVVAGLEDSTLRFVVSAKSTDDSLCPISLLPGVDIGCSFASVLQYLVSDRATAVIVFAWLTTFSAFKFVEVGD